MVRPDREKGSNCRLVRADGSEWRVLELRGGERDLRVDAVAAGSRRTHGEPGGNGAPGNGSEAGNGSGPNGDPPSDGAPTLEDELLGRGDRLQWLGEDGDVVWSMKLPMDQAHTS